MLSPEQNAPQCDPETGTCRLPNLPAATSGRGDERTDNTAFKVVYVGDPMCSWCWAVSPVVGALQGWCAERGILFSILAGGLRPGGGDPWNAEFKTFLRHHWQEIGQISGQPFNLELLQRETFNYDSEPPCRAIVTARALLSDTNDHGLTLHRFFAAVQRRFYVDNADPADPDFYRLPCATVGLDFPRFARRFATPEAQEQTRADFLQSRQWGIRAFPSFAVAQDGKAEIIGTGYVALEDLTRRITARP